MNNWTFLSNVPSFCFVQLDVEEAKEVENDHPQWNFGDDEVENDLQNDDNQFATESDSDTN